MSGWTFASSWISARYVGCTLASWRATSRKLGLIPLGFVLVSIFSGAYIFHLLVLLPNFSIFPFFVFNSLVALILWSLAAAVLIDPGEVPPSLRYGSQAQQEHHENQHRRSAGEEDVAVATSLRPSNPHSRAVPFKYLVSSSGIVQAKTCYLCNAAKPARTHHCRLCERCVLRMDHHCLLINNCIGAANHKFFFLFIHYALAAVLSVSVFSARALWHFVLEQVEAHTLRGRHGLAARWNASAWTTLWIVYVALSYVVCAGHSIGLLALCSVSWHNVLHNVTTIETYEPDWKTRFAAFNVGWRATLTDLFGVDRWTWPLPIRTNLSRSMMALPPDSASPTLSPV